MTRILIDQDSTVYDLITPWYALHNAEFGHIHELLSEGTEAWETGQRCKANNCPAPLFEYFNCDHIWLDGQALPDSIEVTKQWVARGYELAIATKIVSFNSASLKLQWLKDNIPHIPNVFTLTKDVKGWIDADFLIDDAIHSHDHFKGISILFAQPWNASNTTLPRARDWSHVELIVSRGVYLLNNGYRGIDVHKIVQNILANEIERNVL